MIQVDKTDELYKYLQALGVEDIEGEYIELAQNGRYKRADIRQYYRAMFEPSKTEDVVETELEKVLDYYIDIKKAKTLNDKALRQALLDYKATKSEKTRELIINSQLKDILYLCLNYYTLHKDVDIQDLVQVANIGLLDAIDKYQEAKKIDFKDYVIYWTRVKIKEEFEEKKNG
ncbi:MAG: hypothetical protein E7351_03300 [Clostridiales bacterium]|nr:hypothetical protein [Clostridiales bacterium]